MQVAAKRQAIRDYKERKPRMGIYAVRCLETGEVWVGQSRNLDAQQNRLWFSLRLGSERNTALQQAWDNHGSQAMSFEVMAKLGEEEVAFPDSRLKELLAEWSERLAAMPI